jgi:hypothetical protein
MLAISTNIYTEFSVELAASADTATKILSFGQLPVGWHYGEGGPINRNIINTAIALFWQFFWPRFTDTDAFPGVDGEIMVTAYEGNHYVEVIVEADGTMSLTHEFEDEEMCALERRTPEEVSHKLAEVVGEIWNTSAFYTAITLIPDPSKIALKVWHSETPPRMVEPLWSSDPVWMLPVQAFANMQRHITHHE